MPPNVANRWEHKHLDRGINLKSEFQNSDEPGEPPTHDAVGFSLRSLGLYIPRVDYNIRIQQIIPVHA